LFDHIGFLVSEKAKGRICENAEKMNWEVDSGERRTFITTPYHFRIELQTNTDVIDAMDDDGKIMTLKLTAKMEGLERDFSHLFTKPVTSVISEVGNEVTMKEAVIKGFLSSDIVDPNGVRIFNNR
jgi:hypothetical protein